MVEIKEITNKKKKRNNLDKTAYCYGNEKQLDSFQIHETLRREYNKTLGK